MRLLKTMSENERFNSTEQAIIKYILAHNKTKTKASDADLILLGPQVRFSLVKIENQCPGIPVESIDMRMDGKGVIEFAKEKLQ